MTAIGGFFPLELPGDGAPYHKHALALATGRACLRRILECVGPSRVWTPFYVCDAVLPAIRHTGASVEFYAIDAALDPVLPAGQPSEGDAVIYVNYFGIKKATASEVARAAAGRAIIDDTQAFFQTGYPPAYSFNSARKFFGVPDGGYAFGDGLDRAPVRTSGPVHYEHLVTALMGDRALAFDQYRRSEECMTHEPVAMSGLSRRLLSGVDYASVRRTRVANFNRLHARLGARNRLTIPDGGADAGPYCYPLLAAAPVSFERFWARELFVPRLWPEVATRSGPAAFEWERELAACLLPLPIDQRYGAADMDRVADIVGEVLKW